MLDNQSSRYTLLLGFCTGILFLVMFVSPLVFAEQGGTNIVAVDSCQESSSGITVERFGKIQTLPNGCRDAGHGERAYTLSCESDTLYRVTWTPCVPTTQDEPPMDATDNVSSAQDTTDTNSTAPPSSNNESSSSTQDDGCGAYGYFHTTAELGDHCHCDSGYIQHPNELMCISAAAYVDLTTNTDNSSSQESPTPQQSSQTDSHSSQPQDDGCGPHGWLHGSHCHCDSGYIEHPDNLTCISTQEYVSLTTQTPDPQPTTQHQSSTPTQSSQPEDDGCGPYGWLHGEHCHCDAGYIQHPDQLVCMLLDEYVLLFGSGTETSDTQRTIETHIPEAVPSIQDTDSCAPHGVLHNDHCDCHAGYIPEGLSCVSLSQFLESSHPVIPDTVAPSPIVNVPHTNTSDPCAPHGYQHGDHCDCHAGYIGQGLLCVSLSSLIGVPDIATVSPISGSPNLEPAQDLILKAIDIEDDEDGCGPGGLLHNDHCDCDAGFLPIDLMCVPIESLLTAYTTHKGNTFTEASLVFDQYLAAYPEDDDRVILSWKTPEGPYDGFLIQASMDDTTIHAKVLPKHVYAYRYIAKESGLHDVSVLPYVLLEDGSPLLYEEEASTLVYTLAEAPTHIETKMLETPEKKGILAYILQIEQRIASAFSRL